MLQLSKHKHLGIGAFKYFSFSRNSYYFLRLNFEDNCLSFACLIKTVKFNSEILIKAVSLEDYFRKVNIFFY